MRYNALQTRSLETQLAQHYQSTGRALLDLVHCIREAKGVFASGACCYFTR